MRRDLADYGKARLLESNRASTTAHGVAKTTAENDPLSLMRRASHARPISTGQLGGTSLLCVQRRPFFPQKICGHRPSLLPLYVRRTLYARQDEIHRSSGLRTFSLRRICGRRRICGKTPRTIRQRIWQTTLPRKIWLARSHLRMAIQLRPWKFRCERLSLLIHPRTCSDLRNPSRHPHRHHQRRFLRRYYRTSSRHRMPTTLHRLRLRRPRLLRHYWLRPGHHRL